MTQLKNNDIKKQDPHIVIWQNSTNVVDGCRQRIKKCRCECYTIKMPYVAGSHGPMYYIYKQVACYGGYIYNIEYNYDVHCGKYMYYIVIPSNDYLKSISLNLLTLRDLSAFNVKRVYRLKSKIERI